jgi:hypothetical protein
MNNLYRGPSIDASYQVSVHLAKLFQRRRFFLIGQSETRIVCGGQISDQFALRFERRRLKCDGRQTTSDGKSSLCLWQGELKKNSQ